jgi:ribonuclease HI
VQPSALCKSVEAKPEPVIAEAMGVLRAIEFCRELGIQEVIFEGDCSTVVQAINGKEAQWTSH